MNEFEDVLREMETLSKRLKRSVRQSIEQRDAAQRRLWELLCVDSNQVIESQPEFIKSLWRLAHVAGPEIKPLARERLEGLAGRQVADAAYRMGLLCRLEGDLSSATEWLKDADRQGHRRAAFELGFVYLKFDRSETDTQERLRLAKIYLESSAERWDDPETFAFLSTIHRFGLGTEVNLTEARRCLERAVEEREDGSTSPRAQAAYGLECMTAGRSDEALHHLLIGSSGEAARGDAMLNAARILLSDAASDEVLARERIRDADALACELLRRAIARPEIAAGFKYHAPARFELAKLLETGRGCAEDAKQAFELLRQAADSAYPPAVRRLSFQLAEMGLHEEAARYKASLEDHANGGHGDFSDWASADFEARRDAHVGFFNEVNELLNSGDFATALARITALYEWAARHRSDRFAQKAVLDAGIRYQLAGARRGLGQIEAAIEELELSARAKDDPKHQSMCYSAMAECAEIAGDYERAARYYYDSFLVSWFPDMWIKHARAVFMHNPRRRLVALRKIQAFMERDRNWREEDRSRSIPFPVDNEPIKTCVAYADLLWRLPKDSELPHPDSVERIQNQLLSYLRKVARDERRIEQRVVYSLARGSHWPSVRSQVGWLIENVALGSMASREAQELLPFPILASDQGLTLLNALSGGLGRANGYTPDIGASVVRRIAATPEVIRTSAPLGRALAHILWRCIVQSYYRDSTGTADFRQRVYELVLPLVSIFQHRPDKELLRDWMFELVAADKATVEYGLVADFLEEMRNEYLDQYTGPLREVTARLRDDGLNDLHRLAGRLQAPGAMLDHDAFGDLAADTAAYASVALPQYIKYLMGFLLKPTKTRFFVHMTPPANPDALVSAAARVDLTLFLARIASDSGPLLDLITSSKKVNVEGRWLEPSVAEFMITCFECDSSPMLLERAGRALDEISASHRPILRGARVFPPDRRSGVQVKVRVSLAQQLEVALQPDEDWREYLISLIQEHREHRQNGTVHPDFFERVRHSMPALGVPAGSTPAHAAQRWALVLHAVCDRFHTFFAESLLRSDNQSRNPLGALHDLKTALSRLYDSAMRQSLREEALQDFRGLVRALTPTAEQLLKRTLSGWRHTWFDLRAELERPAGTLAQVFGSQHAGVDLLGSRQVLVKAPKEQMLLAFRELLSNARSRMGAGGQRGTVVVEFQRDAVVIRNPRRPRSARPGFSTGRGVIAANNWLAECGYAVVHDATEHEYTVRISRKLESSDQTYA